MSTDDLTPAPEEQLASTGSLPELTLGTGVSTGSIDEQEAPRPIIVRGKLDKDGTGIGTGRRKTSVARVRVSDGTGKITVNKRGFEEYFCVPRDREMILRVLNVTEAAGKVDIKVLADGGGTTGQTGAVILGLARALEARNPMLHYRLAEHGFLTRDDRMVERKKYGRRKARRSFQFSKR
jgi:small subunit ribosomal protein S9